MVQLVSHCRDSTRASIKHERHVLVVCWFTYVLKVDFTVHSVFSARVYYSFWRRVNGRTWLRNVKMAKYGTIGEFNVTGTETWARYINSLGQYFEANQFTDGGRKQAILNSDVGPTTYELFCKLLAPNKPTESSFEEIKESMEKHVIPNTSVIVERSKFNTRVQKSGESLASFAADLRGQAQKAKLPATLDETLRDRFVVGLTDERINRYLLSQGDK